MSNDLEQAFAALKRALDGADNNDFEQALEAVFKRGDADAIAGLLALLDDAHDVQHWMWAILHAAEGTGAGDAEYVGAAVSQLPDLAGHSPEWSEVVVLRILNGDPSRAVLEHLVQHCFIEEAQAVRAIVEGLIARHPEQFEASGQSVLRAMALRP